VRACSLAGRRLDGFILGAPGSRIIRVVPVAGKISRSAAQEAVAGCRTFGKRAFTLRLLAGAVEPSSRRSTTSNEMAFISCGDVVRIIRHAWSFQTDGIIGRSIETPYWSRTCRVRGGRRVFRARGDRDRYHFSSRRFISFMDFNRRTFVIFRI